MHDWWITTEHYIPLALHYIQGQTPMIPATPLSLRVAGLGTPWNDPELTGVPAAGLSQKAKAVFMKAAPEHRAHKGLSPAAEYQEGWSREKAGDKAEKEWGMGMENHHFLSRNLKFEVWNLIWIEGGNENFRDFSGKERARDGKAGRNTSPPPWAMGGQHWAGTARLTKLSRFPKAPLLTSQFPAQVAEFQKWNVSGLCHVMTMRRSSTKRRPCTGSPDDLSDLFQHQWFCDCLSCPCEPTQLSTRVQLSVTASLAHCCCFSVYFSADWIVKKMQMQFQCIISFLNARCPPTLSLHFKARHTYPCIYT